MFGAWAVTNSLFGSRLTALTGMACGENVRTYT